MPAADAVAQEGVAADRAALEALYDATGGPNWTDSTNWKTDAPLSEWYGVATNTAGRVRWLGLSENALSGPIPPALGSLANLRALELSGNALSGPIPPALGNLTNLELLYLGGNALSGPIPAALGNLASLRGLSLGGNALSGAIPPALGNLTNLESLYLGGNVLRGPIPATLGSLANLRELGLNGNALSGAIPLALGNLTNLKFLNLSYNWGLSGPLPASLSRLSWLDIWMTQGCAPAAWRASTETMDFNGAFCGAGPATIDVAVVYTPAARRAAGGTAAIEAVIDLMIAETNQAYEEGGVDHRVALVARSEVPYTESGDNGVDLDRLANPSDGYMDEVHALRDRTEADLVHLLFDEGNVGGVAVLGGAFGLTCQACGGRTFAHELGHNMGLEHDRYQVHHHEGGLSSHPAYGYVNQRAFEPAAAQSSGWITIMAYYTQCADAGVDCSWPLRFSNARQTWLGDPLGVAFESGAEGVTGPADAAAVLDATALVVAGWRGELPAGVNQPPVAVGELPDQRLSVFQGTVDVDVSPAFLDPDGDALRYAASSTDPAVVTARAEGARVTLAAVAAGTVEVRVTATDPGGLGAVQSFTVTVPDDAIVPGVTPVRAIHFTALRSRIDAVRAVAGLAAYGWTDAVLVAGVTPIRLVHLLELRMALEAAYAARGRPAPLWTDAAPVSGTTPIRAAHLLELHAAAAALE